MTQSLVVANPRTPQRSRRAAMLFTAGVGFYGVIFFTALDWIFWAAPLSLGMLIAALVLAVMSWAQTLSRIVFFLTLLTLALMLVLTGLLFLLAGLATNPI